MQNRTPHIRYLTLHMRRLTNTNTSPSGGWKGEKGDILPTCALGRGGKGEGKKEVHSTATPPPPPPTHGHGQVWWWSVQVLVQVWVRGDRVKVLCCTLISSPSSSVVYFRVNGDGRRERRVESIALLSPFYRPSIALQRQAIGVDLAFIGLN